MNKLSTYREDISQLSRKACMTLAFFLMSNYGLSQSDVNVDTLDTSPNVEVFKREIQDTFTYTVSAAWAMISSVDVMNGDLETVWIWRVWWPYRIPLGKNGRFSFGWIAWAEISVKKEPMEDFQTQVTPFLVGSLKYRTKNNLEILLWRNRPALSKLIRAYRFSVWGVTELPITNSLNEWEHGMRVQSEKIYASVSYDTKTDQLVLSWAYKGEKIQWGFLWQKDETTWLVQYTWNDRDVLVRAGNLSKRARINLSKWLPWGLNIYGNVWHKDNALLEEWEENTSRLGWIEKSLYTQDKNREWLLWVYYNSSNSVVLIFAMWLN